MKLKIFYCLIACIILLVIASAIYYGFTPAPYKTQGFEVPHEANELPKLISYQGKLRPTDTGNNLEAIRRFLDSPIEGICLDVTLDARNNLIVKGKEILPIDKVLQMLGKSKYIFLRANSFKLLNLELAEKLNAVIDKYHLSDTVVVESLNPIFLWQYRNIAPYKLIMYDFVGFKSKHGVSADHERIPLIFRNSIIQEWARWILQPDILGPKFDIPVGKLSSFKHNGYPIVTWMVDDPLQAENLFKLGISSIETTNPIALQKVKPVTETIGDASNIEIGSNTEVIDVSSPDDVLDAIQYAKQTKRRISIYGRRHSQGGQALGDDTIALNMKLMNAMHLQDDRTTLTVQAGATWAQVQTYLNTFGRAVKVMQSDNIFTVGGSASVNAFGWQVSAAPFASTVKSFKIALASGTIVECSPNKNAKLFKAALGGYGLLGVIVELDLETVPNYALSGKQFMTSIHDFNNDYALKVTLQPKAELAYGRLDVDTEHHFYDVLLVVYSRDQEGTIIKQELDPHLQVKLKNLVFAAAERNDESRKARWSLERNSYETIGEEAASRNQLMNTDVQTLWPYNARYTDILQTYFIPKPSFPEIFKKLRHLLNEYDQNLLMCTITEVRKDDTSLLAYAKSDMFAITFILSQEKTVEADARLAQFTQKFTQNVLNLHGSFYLPYRPHYTKYQFEQAYPEFKTFLEIKREYDPQTLFINKWYLRYLAD